ncbi:MAG: peptidyl-prolyl cis-trans isomerase, partial [Kiritimatiellaeota bacterium]|nr:peptidyl-prolyl cis-trans isomerase [Kiritimatiellota bacterium]
AADLRAGGDFAAAAREHSDIIPEQGELWKDDNMDDIEPPELAAWLGTAAEGDISEPIEMEDGLSIVKLLTITPGDERDEARYMLARITFYIAEVVTILPQEELRAELARLRLEKVNNALAQGLYDAAAISYPNGTNLFAVPVPSPRQR